MMKEEENNKSAIFEQSFIGGVIIGIDRHGSIDLNASDFEDKYLAKVWEYCQKNEKIDFGEIVSLFDEDYLCSLVRGVPNSIDIFKRARSIQELAYRRRLCFALDIASKRAKDGNLSEIYNYVISAMDNAPKEEEARKLDSIIIDAYHDLSEAHSSGKSVNFVETGMKLFDEKIGGLQKEGLIIVAGRPSMGKTAWASNLAANVGKDGKVLMISMEMSGKQLAMRFLAASANVGLQSMMQGGMKAGDWTRLANGVKSIENHGIWINDKPARTVQNIKAEARRFKRKHGEIDLLIIDYLTLLKLPDAHSKADSVGEVSRGMKLLAGEIGCPVVLISQLNRSLEQRQNKEPLMSDLRDSGAIEQDADQIIFPFRPEVYDKKPENEGVANIIVAKNRNGRTGVVKMAWVGESATFRESQSSTWDK